MADAYITHDPIDTEALIDAVRAPGYGAVVTFAGNIRDSAKGRRVVSIEYTAYEPLALSELRRVASEAERMQDCSCTIAHRLGPIPIGQASVFIAVASPHRQEAFETCRWVIDTIKTTAPIWKRETYDDGGVWIEGEQTYPLQVSD
jgi:molybdopterin synthase catalytic subunit